MPALTLWLLTLTAPPDLAAEATATASSELAGYPAAGAVNGVVEPSRDGVVGYWNDNTQREFPDWLELTWTEPQTIAALVVHQHAGYLGESYDVAVPDGDAWRTIAEVRRNALPKRPVQFDPLTTTKLRLTFTHGDVNGWSHVLEVEAYATAPPEEPDTMTFDDLCGWLRVEAKRQIEGCKRLAHDGVTQCFTPDGVGNYNALWTRDFCYMVEGYPDAVSNVDLTNAVRYLLDGVRADGVAPDRVQADGLAVYSAGGPDSPVGLPPTDNGPFLVKLVALMVQRAGAPDLPELVKRLEPVMASIPRRPDGLVWIDPAGPGRSPYGFTDCIAKTGAVLFSSLLYWEACGCMARLHTQADQPADATRWQAEADRLRKSLDALWDEADGIFLAATDDCHQPDVWGGAYGVVIGAVDDARADRIGQWLKAHYDEVVWNGLVRHMREPAGWQKLLRPVAVNRYQNGAYWPVPTAWVCHALRRVDRDLAHRTLEDCLRWMHDHGVNEWDTPDGAVGVRDYVASATLMVRGVEAERDAR